MPTRCNRGFYCRSYCLFPHMYSTRFGRPLRPSSGALEQYSAHRPSHLYRIYSNPTHDKHQWLLLQFIVLLKMEAKGARNMYSILVVFNKHNTTRVVSCWFIIYYIIVLVYLIGVVHLFLISCSLVCVSESCMHLHMLQLHT